MSNHIHAFLAMHIFWQMIGGALFPFCLAVVTAASESHSVGKQLQIATFECDATPPLGSPLCYGYVPATEQIVDRLSVRGIVILSDQDPIVLCAVDWVGISNAAHDQWRATLADAVGTTVNRVAVHVLHQHDAPGVDYSAGAILAEQGLAGVMYHETFARQTLIQVAEAASESMRHSQPVTHLGWGSARVEKFASNRRILGPDGKVRGVRFTTCKDPALRAEPEGTIDPWVKIVSLWNEDEPVAVLSYYATHPQSYYGRGGVSCDTVGLARGIRQAAIPDAAHLHFNGAGGNVGAGKYNDGAEKNRGILAKRLADGMKLAWESATKRVAVTTANIEWNTVDVQLPVRDTLNETDLLRDLRDKQLPQKKRLRAASGLAWIKRSQEGHKITISCLRIDDVHILHLPGELFVEYQLAAQQMRSDAFVCMAAYGDQGPGYIGTEVSYGEGGYETSVVSRTAPEVEHVLMSAMRTLLHADRR